MYYGKVPQPKHREAQPIYDDRWLDIEEKLDGSQFSFGIFNGELKMFSRKQEISEHQGQFLKAIEGVKSIQDQLLVGYHYYAEAICRPKHNILHYGSCPGVGFILFDIMDTNQAMVSRTTLEGEALRLKVPIAKLFASGNFSRKQLEEKVTELFENESMLGGPKIEGVVVKARPAAYRVKYVSDQFKERQKQPRPQQRGSIPEQIASGYNLKAIWNKAIQHKREEGSLSNSNADIGIILKEIQQDFEEENKDFVKNEIYALARKNILREITKGFAQYYQEVINVKPKTESN